MCKREGEEMKGDRTKRRLSEDDLHYCTPQYLKWKKVREREKKNACPRGRQQREWEENGDIDVGNVH